MKSVVFGGEKHGRLEITVHGYERNATGEYHDDNWLSVEVSTRVGAFHGSFRAAFLTEEFGLFHDQLALLCQTLRGKAEFRTLEEQLEFVVAGDGLGHMHLKGEALDQAGIGNRLVFSLPLDQTQLRSSLLSLSAIVTSFPVRT